ncbi:DUF262 domain-containing protein [Actinoallomurus sp. NPDC052308]|uniref:DUF262 domain-containing protein n=1 Tax=Actinoallomurus sp. NPDC052308 TaxID=3155530 RepID=UPI0034339BE1
MVRRSDPASQLVVFSIEYVVEMIRRGQIRIPSYARRYVWRQEQNVALFDSIARGYPIGTLMFSEGPAPEQDVQFGPLTVHAPAEDRAYWIIDGQQRLVSLAGSLIETGQIDRRFALSYDLRSETFIADPVLNDPLVIPLPVLFETGKLMEWFARDRAGIRYYERASEISWNLRKFQIATYVVRHEDPLVAVDVFERLNTSGVHLRASELFSALTSGGQASGRSRRLEDISASLNERTGFGIVDERTIMRAVLATRTTDIDRIPALASSELQDMQDESERALTQAIVFLQDFGAIPHVSFLPFKNLLVVITRFFALHDKPDVRNLRLLRRWLWRASVEGSEANMGSSSLVTRRFLDCLGYNSETRDVQSLLRSVEHKKWQLPPTEKLAPRTASGRMLLCSWWHRKPRDLRTGRNISRAELCDAIGDSISASKVLPSILQGNKEFLALAANHLLLVEGSGETQELDALLHPVGYVREVKWDDVLQSHMISPAALRHLRQGDARQFFSVRDSAIQGQFYDFIDRMCEWGFEDTPPLADLILDDDKEE